MNDRTIRLDQFLAQCGWSDARRELVAGDASNRRYDRLIRANGETAIVMDAPPERGEDVRPFVSIAEFLHRQYLSAPQIYHQDTKDGFLVIEDLGDDLFADLMAKDRETQLPLYRASVDVLARLHNAPLPPLPLCDADWLMEMTGLFFDWYVPDGFDHLGEAFETTYRPLAKGVAEAERVVILRDYHAQNLLWLPNRAGAAKVGILDFQDALLGHPSYDLMSIMQDARRDVDPMIEAEMIDYYLACTGRPRAGFLNAYAILGLQRNLRILGIFARLCLRNGKAHYVDLIPRVWGYVMRNLEHPALQEVKNLLAPVLARPTPEFLMDLKNRCATTPQQ
ncbi:phosphotransferase [Sulfitobacter mediterraneus]|nr:phosphotransferase [Sulfitobacter mediterraneus]MBM1555355.1 phosphotransferase [Sulfitobacter mediterraneus]MBM1567092.1 phosphotransferase [Sulfitobacter mediterraneus]MBM1570894.1 phosphotransferase [Sulfitobacter mediterraneus]MBM1574694.1 phosphotransferase [Sulfitobacter mediterraneus]MBM1578313.1 phosphotransferase [Sulfitobacter mediterraneus]